MSKKKRAISVFVFLTMIAPLFVVFWSVLIFNSVLSDAQWISAISLCVAGLLIDANLTDGKDKG